MPDTRADLVARSADINQSLANRINAVARVTSGQDSRLAKVLNPVQPSDLPQDARAALFDVLAVVVSLAKQMAPYLQISPPPTDWQQGGSIPPPPTDDNV